MEFIVLQSVNSIALGSLLFLVASGFSLVFGLMKISNLTHAAFYMIGAYVGSAIMSLTCSFGLAAVLAGIATTIIGFIIYVFFLSRLQGQQLSQVLLCLGFLFVLDDALLVAFGGVPRTVSLPGMLAGNVPFMGVRFPVYRLFLIAMGVAVAALLYFLIEKTKVGSIIRAGVDDEETIRAMGVDIKVAFIAVYVLGAFIAGIAGVLGGPIMGMEPRMCFTILPLALAVVIIGGLGSLSGAFWGSMIVGFVDNVGRALLPDFSYFTLFLPMALILAFRPHGLFGGERVAD